MSGTLINTCAIIVGSLLGVAIGKKLHERYQTILIQAMSLGTILFGLQMSLEATNVLALIACLTLGAFVGEWLNIEKRLEQLGQIIQNKMNNNDARFIEGFVTTTLIFCIGTMAILGAIEDGLGKTPEILHIKSLLDGVTSLIFAASMGLGVLFSSVCVLIYQGSISLLTMGLGDFITDQIMHHITVTGGLLISAVGLNLIGATNIRIGNLLPALAFAVLFGFFF